MYFGLWTLVPATLHVVDGRHFLVPHIQYTYSHIHTIICMCDLQYPVQVHVSDCSFLSNDIYLFACNLMAWSSLFLFSLFPHGFSKAAAHLLPTDKFEFLVLCSPFFFERFGFFQLILSSFLKFLLFQEIHPLLGTHLQIG
jgi:hypothetical protein